MKLKDIKIGKRLGFGFGILIVITISTCLLGLINVLETDKKAKEIMQVTSEKTVAANNIIQSVGNVYTSLALLIALKDSSLINAEKESIAKRREFYTVELNRLEKMETAGEAKAMITQFKEEIAKAQDVNNKIYELIRAGDRDAAADFYASDVKPLSTKIASAMENLSRYQEKDMKAKLQGVLSANNAMKISLVAACVLSIVIGAFMAVIITRSITIPIKGSVWAAKRMAEGDLTLEFKHTRKDEFGEEMAGVKDMIAKWREVVKGVKAAVLNISSASQALSERAAQMSKASGEQAGRIAQVATASDEMSQTVGEIARNTQGIATSAEDAVKVAKEGATIVDQSVQEVQEIAKKIDESARSMQSLGERSSQIGEIINVINDIAEQTNLLALNAAIEAARAGEQGRGFAVVADEVKKLAERTANSTSEIGNMISAIQHDVEKSVAFMNEVTQKVEAGVRLSEKAGDSLSGIVQGVDGLLQMVQQIASAAEEMSATSMEINSDIEQIASTARETSANSEQTARSSIELSKLSADLDMMVNQFKV